MPWLCEGPTCGERGTWRDGAMLCEGCYERMGTMTEFGTLEGGTQYLKATFQGFPKSGKSYTATKLMIGTRKHFNLAGPIAYLDTEGAVGYLSAMIRAETGLAPVGARTRNVEDAIKLIAWAEAGNASGVVIDSVSHLWKNLCDGWLTDVNAARKRNRKDALARLPFSAWGPLKAKWGEFMDVFLTSRVHVILCGRAAFEYDFTENEAGESELRKSGVKIVAEKETGYESSLLVEMERVQNRNSGMDVSTIAHRAVVLGDRFGVLDGKTVDDPDFSFFEPHVAMLTPAAHAAVETQAHPSVVNEDGEAREAARRRAREITLEEIEHELVVRWPGQTKEEKLAKAQIVERVFGTGSWKAVTGMDLDKLRAGLSLIRETQTTVATGGAS